jgi:hypothetical protein
MHEALCLVHRALSIYNRRMEIRLPIPFARDTNANPGLSRGHRSRALAAG